MKTKMKSATRRVVVGLVFLVVLAAVALALVLTGGSGDPTPAVSVTSEEEVLTVISRERDTVASVRIKNVADEFSIRATAKGDDTTNVFVVDELSDLPTNGTNLINAVKMAYDLSALLDIGELSDLPGLAEYGLDDPEVTLDVKYNDGTADTTILVGDAAASGGNYILVDGHVYTAEIGSYVYADRYAFLEAAIYTVPIVGDGSDVLDYVKLSGRMLEQPIALEYTATQKNGPYNALFMPYIITAPYYSGMNANSIDELMNILPAPSVAGAAGYDPDEETLKEMGLDDPYLVCDFSINGSGHTLRIGDKHELQSGYRYLLVDDNPVVMVVAESSISYLLDVNDMKLRDGFVWSPVLKKVSGLTLKFDGETYAFENTRTEDSVDSKGNTTYTYTTTLNGDAYDYDAFRGIYSTSITPTVVSTDELKTEAKPTLTLEYSYSAGGSNTVEYYLVTEGERRYAAYVDGDFVGLAKENYVTAIMDAVNAE